MRDESFLYSITYAIEYALINLANSEMFACKKFIEISKLFNKVRKVQLPKILRIS